MTQIDKDTTFKLSIKDAAGLGFVLVSVLSVYFTLKADIALAMEKPEPNISRTEYDLKDELIRQTIMDTQEDVDKILEDLGKIDERLYDIQKNR